MTNPKDCTCTPKYLGECGNCEGDNDGCFLCDKGFVEVSESEYEIDKNTERPFIVVHHKHCKIGKNYKHRPRRRKF